MNTDGVIVYILPYYHMVTPLLKEHIAFGDPCEHQSDMLHFVRDISF